MMLNPLERALRGWLLSELRSSGGNTDPIARLLELCIQARIDIDPERVGVIVESLPELPPGLIATPWKTL